MIELLQPISDGLVTVILYIFDNTINNLSFNNPNLKASTNELIRAWTIRGSSIP